MIDQKRIYKKAVSWRGYIPSEDMSTFDFQLWLECATIKELENDVVTFRTAQMMSSFYSTHS